MAIKVGSDGSLLFSGYNHVIRRVGPDGIITTIAGTGMLNSSGDGGPATAASLSQPYGIEVGKDGSLYIVDHNTSIIRHIASALPGFTGSAINVPSEDGSKLYQFNSQEKHLNT